MPPTRTIGDRLPRFAYYYNEYADLIGHDAEGVNSWLTKHPNYIGHIWFNYGDDGEDIDVSDIFRADRLADELAAPTEQHSSMSMETA